MRDFDDGPMIPDEQYEWAEANDVCVNCWHTLACCAGRCDSEDSMDHDCEPNA